MTEENLLKSLKRNLLLSELVVSLEVDYASLYKTLKGRHYADFQMKWLEHVRHVAEYGYALATMDAQVVDQDEVCLPSSESFGKWASVWSLLLMVQRI